MTFTFSIQRMLSARLIALSVVLWGWTAVGQDALEFQELQGNLRTAYARIQALEKASANGGAPAGALLESSAAASAEAAELKQRYTELRGLLDALGIAAIEGGGDGKADRLVAALNDLRLVKEEQERLGRSLVELVEASMEYSQVATPGNPESVRKLGAAIEGATSALKQSGLNPAEPKAKDLNAATVVSVKSELGVVVLDIGSRDGAKPGMPFNLYREDKPIAKVLVTDVRKSISGAVVRELFSQTDKPMVGDRGQADAS
jgi:hypothetical protein